MLTCPICHGEVVPDSKNAGKYLCYNCKKRMPAAAAIEVGGDDDFEIPDDFAVSEPAPAYQPPAYQEPAPQPATSPYGVPAPEEPAYQDPFAVPVYDDDDEPYEGNVGYAPETAPTAAYAAPAAHAQQAYGQPQEAAYQGQQPYGAQPPYQEAPYQQPDAPKPPKQKGGKALGIVAFVLALLAVLAAIVPFLGILISAPLAIIALVVGIIAVVKNSIRPLSIVSVILSILAIPLSLVISTMVINSAVEDAGGNLEQIVNDIENGNTDSLNQIVDNINAQLENSNAANGAADANTSPASNSAADPNAAPDANLANVPVDDPSAPVSNVHGNLAPTSYVNDLFGVEVQAGDAYSLEGDPEGRWDAKATLSADPGVTLTVQADPIASPDVNAYLTSRQALEGGEIRMILVAGQQVPALVNVKTYPDGVTEAVVVIAKIVDGNQIDLTAVAPDEARAMETFGCVTRF